MFKLNNFHRAVLGSLSVASCQGNEVLFPKFAIQDRRRQAISLRIPIPFISIKRKCLYYKLKISLVLDKLRNRSMYLETIFFKEKSFALLLDSILNFSLRCVFPNTLKTASEID
jgi:hypothetical protein